ncbi:MAG: dynamin family protein [Hydrogenophaga sp.]|uniref:dynamin family protein n=1 Tax=Hydrogenophaga sp. TaxID=1904254 RepID=UPI0027271433|nr:dynamin family protein [Hydrogenophaga sp.]MDO9571807.1 dynamin family protein [Hydrogenophaga sp.]MDP3372688.1 dynamin family protein [Hydrogenophaga sp.]
MSSIKSEKLIAVFNQLRVDCLNWRKAFNKPDYDDRFGDLHDLQKDLIEKLRRFASDEQNLSIGIMGQVKAGKSSFLNAVLFDGVPVLPEAATPKTANLTRIIYGEKPILTVTYYEQEEWNELIRLAIPENSSAEGKVARELIKLASDNKLNISTILKKGSEKIEAGDEQELRKKLNDYVGENGKFTALVKMTEIALPRPELKGYEVVDTPGMNDPVVSREAKTKEYMAQCDVVFFLSRCGQFLDAKDLELLSRLLPGKGVKRIYLVAVQFDSAILDDGPDCSSLTETEKNIHDSLLKRSIDEIDKCIEMHRKVGHLEMAKLLITLKIPIFTSSYAHGIGAWPMERWRSQESIAWIHDRINDLSIESWGGKSLTQNEWLRIGNFPKVLSTFDIARKDKAALIEQQRQCILPESERNLQVWRKELQETVIDRSTMLRKSDLAQLEKKKLECQNRLTQMVAAMKNEISAEKSNANKVLREILQRLKNSDKRVGDFRVQTGVESYQVFSHTESTKKLLNPLSWLSKPRDVYETRYRDYQYISRADAVEQVMLYGKDQASGIQREFDKVVSVKILRAKLQQVLLEQLEAGDKNFDPGHFRNTFGHVISQLKLPVLQLEYGGAIQSITNQFASELRDTADAEHLRQATVDAKQTVHDDLHKECSSKVGALCHALDTIVDHLANEMPTRLHQEMEQLRVAFANKERELDQYNALLKLISSQK